MQGVPKELQHLRVELLVERLAVEVRRVRAELVRVSFGGDGGTLSASHLHHVLGAPKRGCPPQRGTAERCRGA